MWKIELEDYDKLNLEVLSKVLQDGEKYFDGIIDDNNAISNRAYTWLTIIASYFGLLITFIISKIGVTVSFNERAIIFLNLILIVVGCYCLFLLIKIIFPAEKMVKGNQPKPVVFEALTKESNSDQLKFWLLDSIENIQHKIDHNENLIQNRIADFSIVIKAVTVSFAVSLILILILVLTTK